MTEQLFETLFRPINDHPFPFDLLFRLLLLFFLLMTGLCLALFLIGLVGSGFNLD